MNRTALYQEHLGSAEQPGADAVTPLGTLGALMVYDLYKRHPTAEWFAYLQGDTYIGEWLLPFAAVLDIDKQPGCVGLLVPGLTISRQPGCSWHHAEFREWSTTSLHQT